MQLNINGKVVAIVAASALACAGLGLAVSQQPALRPRGLRPFTSW